MGNTLASKYGIFIIFHYHPHLQGLQSLLGLLLVYYEACLFQVVSLSAPKYIVDLKPDAHDTGTKETAHIEREKYILVGGSWLQNWSHRLTSRMIIYSIHKIIKLTILCLSDGGCYYCFIEISHRFEGVPLLHRNSRTSRIFSDSQDYYIVGCSRDFNEVVIIVVNNNYSVKDEYEYTIVYIYMYSIYIGSNFTLQ